MEGHPLMLNALRSIKGPHGAFLLVAAYGCMAMAEPETSSASALDEIVVFADPNDLLTAWLWCTFNARIFGQVRPYRLASAPFRSRWNIFA